MAWLDEPTVLFVSLTGHYGGPTRSLATLLPLLDGRLGRVLAVPREGGFTALARQDGLVDAYVRIPRTSRLPRLARLLAAAVILWWALRNRRSLALIHANGTAELNVVGPAAALLRKPVVVWAHGSDLDPWARRLLPIWRRTLTLRWAAVSATARSVLAEWGVPEADVAIIPNPIDPRDVRVEHHDPPGLTVGFLGYPLPHKGLQLVPRVVERLADVDLTWLLFTEPWNHPLHPHADDVFDELEAMDPERVRIMGHHSDAREAYARCSLVFCPSLQESFCRVAAEAMLNGIPVVGSAIPALEALVGDGEAGLLFPPGDAAAAAAAIRRLVQDDELRRTLGERGRARAGEYDPLTVARLMLELYGLARA